MRINYILDPQHFPTGKLYKWCIWGLNLAVVWYIVHVLRAWGLLNGHSCQCRLTMPGGHERVMGAEILNWASQISRHLPGNQHDFPQDVARGAYNMLARQAESDFLPWHQEVHGHSQIDYRILIRLFYQAPSPVEKTHMFYLISEVPWLNIYLRT